MKQFQGSMLDEFYIMWAPKNQQAGQVGQTAAEPVQKCSGHNDHFPVGGLLKHTAWKKDTTFKMSQ